MFYAHQGNSNDSAFTTFNGCPTRSFKAFKTKKERAEYQDKIWKESGQTKNLIFCYRKDVTDFYPKFYVSGNDVFAAWEDYQEYLEYQNY